MEREKHKNEKSNKQEQSKLEHLIEKKDQSGWLHSKADIIIEKKEKKWRMTNLKMK